MKGKKNQISKPKKHSARLVMAYSGAILVDGLMDSCASKGEITKKKIAMEKNQTLARIGEEWLLEFRIKTTFGEAKDQAGKQKQIADTVEAIIGAIYLDAGFETTKKVVQKWYKEIDQ